MKLLSSRERLLILVALAIAVFIVIDALTSGGTPGSRALAQARQKQAQMQRDLSALHREIDELQRQIGKRLTSGTPRGVVQDMVVSAQAAAGAAGLKLEDVKPSEPDEISGIRRVPVHVRLTARFPQAARFLYELERRNAGYQVSQVQLVAKDPQSDRLDMEVRLVAYVAGEKEKQNAAKG
jgi:Tfp pilus assembly protein PilO